MMTTGSIRSPRRAAGLAWMALVLAFTAPDAHAGAWVKQPGETYAKLSGGAFFSDGIFDINGTLVPDPALEYGNAAAYAYLEMGLLPRVALGLSLPWFAARNTLNGGGVRFNRRGAGDLDIHLQGQIIRAPIALALQLSTRLPLYSGVLTSVTGSSFQNPDHPRSSPFFPALGDGSVDITPVAQIGWSMHPIPGWLQGEAGVRLRTRGFGHQFTASAGGGVFIWPEHLAITARAAASQRLSAVNDSPTSSMINAAAGLLIPIAAGFSLEAEAGIIPWGAFVARGYTIMAGVSWTGSLFPDPFGG
ncbi:MAG: hypothetical protein GMKNLPBB_01655 [Myxococcota bacterium]|nr:hypothetical protein [Myxococcota bacterium]